MNCEVENAYICRNSSIMYSLQENALLAENGYRFLYALISAQTSGVP